MKKMIILTMLLAFAAASFCQQITPKQDWTETDYYKKSKKQKTTAWILLGSGVALFAGGLIAHYNHVNNPDDFEDAVVSSFGGDDATGVAALGLLVAGGSIPLFIASSKNKKKAKAASVFIDIKKAPVLQGAVFSNQLFPAVGVSIRL